MKKALRKEIRKSVESSIQQVISSFGIADLSKKTKKLIENGSKKIADSLKGGATKKEVSKPVKKGLVKKNTKTKPKAKKN